MGLFTEVIGDNFISRCEAPERAHGTPPVKKVAKTQPLFRWSVKVWRLTNRNKRLDIRQ
jgi:hypothetical protein